MCAYLSLADAAEKLEASRRDYNEERPYGAIGNKVPAALMNLATEPSPVRRSEPEDSTVPRGHVGEHFSQSSRLKTTSSFDSSIPLLGNAV